MARAFQKWGLSRAHEKKRSCRRCPLCHMMIVTSNGASDVLAGKANGAGILAVTYGFGSVEELVVAGPDQCCHNPAEVRRAFNMP